MIRLTSVLDGWVRVISSVMEMTQNRQRTGPGPQAEIEYWSEQNATLTALAEQLERKQVRYITRILFIFCFPFCFFFFFDMCS